MKVLSTDALRRDEQSSSKKHMSLRQQFEASDVTEENCASSGSASDADEYDNEYPHLAPTVSLAENHEEAVSKHASVPCPLVSTVLTVNSSPEKSQQKTTSGHTLSVPSTIAGICDDFVLEETLFRNMNPWIPADHEANDLLPSETKICVPQTNVVLKEESSSISLSTIPRIKLKTIKAICDAYRIEERVFRASNPSIKESHGYEEPLPKFCVVKLPCAATTARSSKGNTMLSIIVHPAMMWLLYALTFVLVSIIIGLLQVSTDQDLEELRALVPTWLMSVFELITDRA